VAGFIGETNIIPAVYDGYESDTHYVTCSAGRIASDKVYGTFKKGDAVFISTRPEQIGLDDGGHINILECELRRATYLGELEQLQLETCGIKIKANVTNPQHAHSGTKLRIQIPKSSVLILPPDPHLGTST
jgi:ABC-type Fe3+/spermidine/putrescine transport system ATPase subunit